MTTTNDGGLTKTEDILTGGQGEFGIKAIISLITANHYTILSDMDRTTLTQPY